MNWKKELMKWISIWSNANLTSKAEVIFYGPVSQRLLISISQQYINEAAIDCSATRSYQWRLMWETLTNKNLWNVNGIEKWKVNWWSLLFDIILPEGNNSVSTEIINTTQAKLTQLRQQSDELNKQVFALPPTEPFYRWKSFSPAIWRNYGFVSSQRKCQ
jgi:hypothetical protein